MKQTIECFMAALPEFLKEVETYKANMKVGKRPAKNGKIN